MNGFKEIEIRGHRMVLHPLKALWWPEESILVCSDVHIGKGAHFRSSGIPVPKLVNASNLWNLVIVLEQFKPKHLIFLGDLFHSGINAEWTDLTDCLDQFPKTERILIRGNHEFLSDETYMQHGLKICNTMDIQRIILSHEPLSNAGEDVFNLTGHVHPAVRLLGSGRQHLRIPCFWMNERSGIMPAFGAFTGNATIKPQKNDVVFGFVDNTVVRLN